MKTNQKTLLSLAIASLFTANVYAQAVPNIGDALKQSETPKLQTAPTPALPNIGGIQIEAPMTALPTGPKIMVKGFEIMGNREIAKDVLQALVASDSGKELTLSELEDVAKKITLHYRTTGYFVARAYIPAQEVEGNVIKIRVVEGNYGQFHLKNQSLVRDDIVQGMLDDVKSYDIVSLDTLERAMLIINDTPGAQIVQADVMPGQKVGTSDFAVGTVATPAQNGFVMLDNYGSAYTGEHRMSFNYDSNSPAGLGDRLSISGMATEAGGLLNGRVGYSTLLMPNGLRGELAVSHTRYALGGTYSNLDAKGTAKAVDATFTYPIRRIRAQTIEASLNFAKKDLEDRIDSTNTVTPKDSKSMTAGLNLRDERNLFGFDGLTTASISATVGDLSINDATARADDSAGIQSNGSFSKANISLSRVSLLPEQFTLTASFRAQQSLDGKNLDSSERMAVSGSSGVYAYPAGELMGTNARLARVELAHPLPEMDGLQHSALVFATHGYAESANAISTTDKGRDINDVGLGWKANYQNVMLNAHLAYRVEDTAPTSEKVDRVRLLVQAGYLF